jgi:hypothetical protein
MCSHRGFSETISSTIQFKEDKVFSSKSTCTDIREHEVDSIVNYNPRLLFKEKQGTMGWWGELHSACNENR